jgi:hypothetical protein
MTKQASRVSELSVGTGTGTLVMTGAVVGYRSWTDAFGTGDTEVYYGVIQDGTGEWEVGIGTYKGGSHAMQRDTVLAGSNGTSKVVFPAGDKIVYSTFPGESTLTLTAANLIFTGAVGGLTLTNPILAPATLTDGALAATIGIERAWALVQQGSGAATGLELRSQTAGSKTFRLVDSTRETGFQFWPSLSSISALTQPDILFNDPITAPSATIANNATAALYFTDAAGSGRGAIYTDTGSNLVTRNDNSSGRIIIEPTGTIQLQGTLAGVSFGARVAAARANMTDHIELNSAGYGITVTSASLNLVMNNSAATYFVDKDSNVHASIDQEGTVSPSIKTVITREKGDIRYATLANPNFFEQTETIAADGAVGWRIYNAAKTLERANMFATGSNFAIRNTGLTAATTCQVLMESGGDFNLNVGRYVGDGGGITNLSAAAVGIGVAGIASGGIGDTGLFRMASTDTAITWGTNYAAASLRRAGISTAEVGWDTDIEGPGNIAPATGTWQARSSILARSGRYCIGQFRRVL